MSYYEGQSAPEVIRGDDALATFWRRFSAQLLDSLLIVLAATIIVAFSGATYDYEYLVLLVLELGYFTLFEGSPRGQTPGKSLMRIRVISFDTGGPIGYSRAFVRSIGRLVSSIPLYLGYLWMLWDPESQTWHDKMARSVVINVDPPAPAGFS
jgi:uncharacterized RDD family membrane protein YckC